MLYTVYCTIIMNNPHVFCLQKSLAGLSIAGASSGSSPSMPRPPRASPKSQTFQRWDSTNKKKLFAERTEGENGWKNGAAEFVLYQRTYKWCCSKPWPILPCFIGLNSDKEKRQAQALSMHVRSMGFFQAKKGGEFKSTSRETCKQRSRSKFLLGESNPFPRSKHPPETMVTMV